MNFISYIFSKLYFYYGKEYGIISPIILIIGGVIFNLMTIILFLSSFGVFELVETDFHRTTMFRYFLGPLIIVIMCIPPYRYYNKNDYYKTVNSSYERLDERERKRMNIKFIIYVTVSLLMLFGSIISPLFI